MGFSSYMLSLVFLKTIGKLVNTPKKNHVIYAFLSVFLILYFHAENMLKTWHIYHDVFYCLSFYICPNEPGTYSMRFFKGDF